MKMPAERLASNTHVKIVLKQIFLPVACWLFITIIIHRSIVRVCKVCMYILLWVLLQESSEDKVNSNVGEQFTVRMIVMTKISCGWYFCLPNLRGKIPLIAKHVNLIVCKDKWFLFAVYTRSPVVDISMQLIIDSIIYSFSAFCTHSTSGWLSFRLCFPLVSSRAQTTSSSIKRWKTKWRYLRHWLLYVTLKLSLSVAVT